MQSLLTLPICIRSLGSSVNAVRSGEPHQVFLSTVKLLKSHEAKDVLS
ncbi:hypothetical protein SP21_89 [Salmonella phage 21]|nr:hypothetical protein SP21_89 [Salmonella phage 21]